MEGPPSASSPGAEDAGPPTADVAPIEATVARALAAADARPASVGDRLIGLVVDGLVTVGLFIFLGMILAPRLGGATPDGFQLEGIPAALLISVVAALTFVYFVIFEAAFGVTLGKLVAGTRVRTLAGGRISLQASAVRNAMRVVDGVGLYLVGGVVALTNKRRRRLGDLAAGTVVTQRDWPGPVRVIALLVAIAALAAGAAGGIVFRPPAEPPVPRYATIILTDDRNVAVSKELFSPTTPAFFILFTLADVPPDTTLKVVWTAEQVAGERPDLKIDEAVVVAGGQRTQGDFSLARSSFSWPVGAYRADLFIGQRLANTIRFRVEAPPAAIGSPPPSVGSPAPVGSAAPR